jgi:rRNA maturation endonuclease Nob1
MKYCENCKKKLDDKEEKCPVCGNDLKEINTDEEDTANTVATMTMLGIL